MMLPDSSTVFLRGFMASEGIVLLHGIFRTRLSMRSMEKFLRKQGYQVLNLGYKSTRFPLDVLAAHIHPSIDAFSQTVDTVHFVGYSMGGLLTRAYLALYRPVNLGRIVMLATPNKGSEVADRFQHYWLYRKSYGPAGQQLITDQSGFQSLFGPVDFPLGVIAGSRSYDPLSSWMIGQPNDGKVSIESTRLDGMKDHLILPVDHTFFPGNKHVWQATLNFLRHEKF